MRVIRILSMVLLFIPFVSNASVSQIPQILSDEIGGINDYSSVLQLIPANDAKSLVYKNCRISYIHTNPDGDYIYVMNQDGTGKTKLADKAHLYAWSPDGKKIVYVASDGGNYQIKSVAANGKNTIALTPTFKDEIKGILWSPDGKTIVFGLDQTNSKSLNIMIADGGNLHMIEIDYKGNKIDKALWSPDGRYLALSDEKSIYLVDFIAGKETIWNLTSGFPYTDINDFIWLPDSVRIALYFEITEKNGNYIKVIDSGFDVIDINTKKSWGINFEGSSPNWSPDGKLITYTGYADDEPQQPDSPAPNAIFVMNSDGSNVKKLTNFNGAPEAKGNPVWSPNGKFIAFLKKEDYDDHQPSELYVMNKDGSNLRPLVLADNYDALMYIYTGPSWSPDGSKILYTQYSEFYTENFYTVSVEGTKTIRNLSKNTEKSIDENVYNHSPIWVPVC